MEDVWSKEAQTLSASRLLLISAPSSRVCRSALEVSAPRSFPARSIRENFPCSFPRLRKIIWNTAWLREEWAFADVCPDVLKGTQWFVTIHQILHSDCSVMRTSYNTYLQLFPTSISFRTSSVHFTSFSCSPTTCTCCFPSSRTRNLALRFRRSNTYKHKYNLILYKVVLKRFLITDFQLSKIK